MATEYMQLHAADSYFTGIRKIYANMAWSAQALQVYLTQFVREMSETSKKNVMDKEGEAYQLLEFLFKNSPKGMDRGTLSAWFVAYTPLRPRFDKKTGHYQGIGWARKGSWDVDGAYRNAWYNEDPEATRAARVPKLEAQIAQLIKAAAKIAAVSDVSAAELAKKIKEGTAAAQTDIKKMMENEAVQNFATQYKAEQKASATVH